MSILLPILYLILLAMLILLLILAISKPLKKRWSLLFLAEAISEAAAVMLMHYYNELPGAGIMPGMTYFAETVYSMIAAAAYAGMLAVSLLAYLLLMNKGKNK